MKHTLLLSILICSFASSSFGQGEPTPHSGWPVSMPEDEVYRTIDTAIATRLPDGTPIFGASSYHKVGLMHMDGSFIPGWPKEFFNPYVAAGPYIGEVDGDNELDVIIALRGSGAGQPHRRICKYSIDGILDQEFTRDYYDPTAPVYSNICLADLNNDSIDEVIYLFDQLHVDDGNGLAFPGFPWDLGGTPARKIGPTIAIPPFLTTPTIYWVTREPPLIHARQVGSEDELPGWPINYNYEDFEGPPIFIPLAVDQWVLSIARTDSLYAWNHSGQSRDGFPIPLPEIGHDPGYYLTAGDVDGDSIPDIVFKSSSVESAFAYDLNANPIEGFPIGTRERFFSETISIIRDSEQHAMIFSTEQWQQDFGSNLVGYRQGQVLLGFPAQIDTVNSHGVTTSNAVLLGNDTLHILHNTLRGTIMLWDVAIDAETIRLEWPMPGNTPGGLRMYIPQYEVGVDKEFWRQQPEDFSIGALFPNPGNGCFTLPFKSTYTGSIEISVYSLAGSLVWKNTVNAIACQPGRITWSGTTLSGGFVSSGVYIIKLSGAVDGIRKAVLIK